MRIDSIAKISKCNAAHLRYRIIFGDGIDFLTILVKAHGLPIHGNGKMRPGIRCRSCSLDAILSLAPAAHTCIDINLI